MDKLQIDKKLLIDIILISLLLLGAFMFFKNQPGGVLIVLFTSLTWSILILTGVFYLFRSKDFYSIKIWSLVVGLLMFIVPISYCFQILSLPGYELFIIYSITILPIFVFLFTILFLIKIKSNFGSYFLNMLIRLIILFVACIFVINNFYL